MDLQLENHELTLKVAYMEASIAALNQENDDLLKRVKELSEAMIDLLEWVEPLAGDNQDKVAARDEEHTVVAARAVLTGEPL